MPRAHQSKRRLIVGAHGRTKEPRGRQSLQPWERGEAEPPITKRELDLLGLLAEDLTLAEAAQIMRIGYGTTYSYSRRLRWRAGALTLQGVVAWGFRRGLLR